MNKTILLSAIFLWSFSTATAQVGEIKDASDNNKDSSETTTTTTEGKDNTNSGSDGCLSEACGWACSSGCSWFLDHLIVGISHVQRDQLKKKKDIPEITSLELMPHFGYAEPSSSLIMPRIRGNWGIFSTDLRFSNMTDFGSDGIDFYNTFDWQILEMNFLIQEPVIARFGVGMMYENYSRSAFMEYFLGADVNWKDHLYLANGEFRIAKDYSNGATPRLETNLRFNYRLIKTPSLNGYAMGGGIYQNYYSGVDVWSIQAGLLFNFH